MPRPSFGDWIQAAKPLNPNASDTDLSNYYRQTYGSGPNEDDYQSWAGRAREQFPDQEIPDEALRTSYTRRFGPIEEISDVGRALSAAGSEAKALGGGLVGLAGDTLGLEGVRDWGLQTYKENMQDVAGQQRQQYEIDYLLEKGTPGDWADALQYHGVKGLTSLIGGLGAGAVGRIAAKQAVKRTFGEYAKDALAKEAIEKAAGRGFAGGLGGYAVGQELGSIYPEAVEEAARTGGDVDLAKVYGYGLAAGAVEGLSNVALMGLAGMSRFLPPGMRMTALAPETGGRLARAGKAVTGAVLTEGAEEGLQNPLEYLGANKELGTEQFWAEQRQSMFAGAAGGLGGGGLVALPHLLSPRALPAPESEQTGEPAPETQGLLLEEQAAPEIPVDAGLRAAAEANQRAIDEAFAGERDVRFQVSARNRAATAQLNARSPQQPTEEPAVAVAAPVEEETQPAFDPTVPAANLSTQEIVDTVTGAGRKKGRGRSQAMSAAFNEMSGEYTVDPETQVERQLNVGEALYRRIFGSLPEKVLSPAEQILGSLSEEGRASATNAQNPNTVIKRVLDVHKELEELNTDTPEDAAAAQKWFAEYDEKAAGSKARSQLATDELVLRKKREFGLEPPDVTQTTAAPTAQAQAPAAPGTQVQVNQAAAQEIETPQEVNEAFTSLAHELLTNTTSLSKVEEAALRTTFGLEVPGVTVAPTARMSRKGASGVVPSFSYTAVGKALKAAGLKVNADRGAMKRVIDGAINKVVKANPGTQDILRAYVKQAQEIRQRQDQEAAIELQTDQTVTQPATMSDEIADTGGAVLEGATPEEGAPATRIVSSAQGGISLGTAKDANLAPALTKDEGLQTQIKKSARTAGKAEKAFLAANGMKDLSELTPEEQAHMQVIQQQEQIMEQARAQENAEIIQRRERMARSLWSQAVPGLAWEDIHVNEQDGVLSFIAELETVPAEQRRPAIQAAAAHLRGEHEQGNIRLAKRAEPIENLGDAGTAAVQADAESLPPRPDGESVQVQGADGSKQTAAVIRVKRKRVVTKPTPDLAEAGEGVRNPTTREHMERVIKAAIGRKSNWRIHLYDTFDDAVAAGANEKLRGGYATLTGGTGPSRTMGWVENRNGVRHVTFILGNIRRGRELSVFMHEVGAHIGLEGILLPGQLNRLAQQVRQWGASDNLSVEAEIARNALRRIESAKVPDAKMRKELIAYFLEEAVRMGIDPTAMREEKGAFARWMTTIMQAFDRALRKLGLKPEEFTAQEFVDLAFGAANLEFAETEQIEIEGDVDVDPEFAAAARTKRGMRALKKYAPIPRGKWDRITKKHVDQFVRSTPNLYMASVFNTEGEPYVAAGAVVPSPVSDNRAVEFIFGPVKGIVSKTLKEDPFDDTGKLKSPIRAFRAAIGATEEIIRSALADGFDISFTGSNDQRQRLYTSLLDRVGFEYEEVYAVGDAIALDDFFVENGLDEFVGKHPYAIRRYLREQMKARPELKDEITYLLDEIHETLDPHLVIRAVDFVEFDAAPVDPTAFGRWFEDSQVVDEMGRPAIVYHGTPNNDFTSFYGEGPWAHFGTAEQANNRLKDVAEDNFMERIGRYPLGGYVMPVYLSVQNPLTIKDIGAWHNARAVANAVAEHFDTKRGTVRPGMVEELLEIAEEAKEVERSYGSWDEFKDSPENHDLLNEIRSMLEMEGYDGFRYKNQVEGEGYSWVVLRPEQVKSASGNQGRYNAQDDDIMFSQAEDSVQDTDQNTVDRNVEKLAEPVRPAVQSLVDTIRSAAQKTYTGLAFLKDLGDIVSAKVPALAPHITKLMDSITATKVERVRREKVVTDVLDRYHKLDEAMRKRVNTYLALSRERELWGYLPEWKGNVTVDKGMAKKFEALPAEAQQVVKDVNRIMWENLQLKQDLINQRITDSFDRRIELAGSPQEAASLEAEKAKALKAFGKTLTEIPGPYVPFKRHGKFVVQAFSAQMAEAKANEDWKRVEQLRVNPEHYVLEFAESRHEARKRLNELQNEFGTNAEYWEKAQWREHPVVGLQEVERLRSYIAGIVADDGSERSQQLLNMADDLALQVMSENHARQSAQHSKNIRGYDPDMIRGFVTQGRSDAHYIANLRHLKDSNDAVNSVARFVESYQGRQQAGIGRDELTRLANAMYWHWGKSMDYQPAAISDRMAAISSAWYLLFSPAYYLQNMTQVGMMSVPWMAGRFGWGTTQRETLRAYKDVKDMVFSAGAFDHFDTSLVPDDVKHVVEALLDSGAINITMDLELGQVAQTGDSLLAKGQRTFDQTIRRLPTKIETLNRVVTGIAAYRLIKQSENVHDQHAINYARKVIDITHGDYDGVNTPKFLSPKLIPGAKVLFQFRKFQIIQLSYLARLLQNAFKDADPVTRAVARRSLYFTLGHYGLMAGGLGLPGVAFIQSLIGVAGGLFGDDDEPWDSEAQVYKFRKAADQMGLAPEIVDILLNGMPAALDVNLTSRLGAQNVVSFLPYIRADVRDLDSYDKMLAAALGPTASLGKKVLWGGPGQVAAGNYYQAMESVLPNGLRSAVTAFRLATEGDSTYNGDQVLSPEEIGLWETMQTAMGLTAPTRTKRWERQRLLQTYQDTFNTRTSDLKRQFAEAHREGDTATKSRLRQEWKDLQAKKKEVGLRTSPLSDLLKSPAAQRKRERQVAGGVKYDRGTKQFVEETKRLYGQ